MIRIRLNGEDKSLDEALTIQELVLKIEIASQAIAVAVNSEIVPRSQFGKIRVRDGDRVEIIHAVGGG